MSQETQEWLSNFCLIGFTEKRGSAWHYRKGDNNHFPLAIPLEVVRERLFNWQPLEGTVATEYEVPGTDLTQALVDPDRKTVVRPRGAVDDLPAAILGVFSQDYRIHDYNDWLVRNVETILDDDLQVGSAGLLRGGAQAWVQAEVPETVVTPDGVAFRPFLSAATSLDGSMATTYFDGNQVVVCDNTLGAARGRATHTIKRRHTSGSLDNVLGVREALGIVHQNAQTFTDEVSRLVGTPVSDAQWDAFLDAHSPLPPPIKTKSGGPGRGWTIAERKRNELAALYYNDDRIGEFTGTAWGVLQAANTWDNHYRLTRGVDRPQRNAERTVTGSFAKDDAEVLDHLEAVLAAS